MSVRIIVGDCREQLQKLSDQSVQCCVTSPPYFGLRDYGVDGQIGLEPTPDEFVAAMVEVFGEVRRVLRNDGTLWLNLGDSYVTTPKGNPGVRGNINGGKRDTAEADVGATINKSKLPGLKSKDLIGIPWRVAFALQADGWYLRSSIIWHKPNPMPESVTDRPTNSHENLFLLAKSSRYYYDADAVKEAAKDWSSGGPGTGIEETKHYGAGNGGNGGLSKLAAKYKSGEAAPTRNLRNVWTVPTQAYSGAHFATFPPALIEPCIKAGCPIGGTVLDPFGGAGTTGLVADRLGRNSILIELNTDYAAMAETRIRADQPMFADVRVDAPVAAVGSTAATTGV